MCNSITDQEKGKLLTDALTSPFESKPLSELRCIDKTWHSN